MLKSRDQHTLQPTIIFQDIIKVLNKKKKEKHFTIGKLLRHVNCVPLREIDDFHIGFRKPDLGSPLYAKVTGFKKFFTCADRNGFAMILPSYLFPIVT